MSDLLIRGLAKAAGLRAMACITTALTQEAAQRHAAYPIAAAALGHGLTAGILLGALLKAQERVALKVEGDGPLRKLVVEADAYGRVRGYVGVPDPPAPLALDRHAVAAALGGQGQLAIVQDLRLRDLYRSVIAWSGGALDGELTRYFTTSEQTPTFVAIDAVMGDDGQVVAAGGILVQALPGCEHSALEAVAARFADEALLANLLRQGQTAAQLLAFALADLTYDMLETYPIEFRCTCSRERSHQALRLLKPEELQSLIDDGQAIIDCHFCNTRYEFSAEELQDIAGN